MNKQILECCTAFMQAVKFVGMSRKRRVWCFLEVLITQRPHSMQPGISCIETGRKKWAGYGVRNGQGKLRDGVIWWHLIENNVWLYLRNWNFLLSTDNTVRNHTGVVRNPWGFSKVLVGNWLPIPKQEFGSSRFRDKKVLEPPVSMCVSQPQNTLAHWISEASASCPLSYEIMAAQTCFVGDVSCFIHSEKDLRWEFNI